MREFVHAGVTDSTPATTEGPCIDKCLRLETPVPPLPDHLINKMRDLPKLTHDQTLTGLDQASLVIKPGVLLPGRTYFVEVNAAAAGELHVVCMRTRGFHYSEVV